jgi:exopolyphosphatase/pppGpp-phosphohydrolase
MIKKLYNSRLYNYLQNSSGPYIVLFDIGTRATRLLIGSEIRHGWGQFDFFNDAILTNIGSEVSRAHNTLRVDSQSLKNIIEFMGDYISLLKDNNKKFNVTAVGTAVFRNLENKSEVIDKIYSSISLKVKIITPWVESFLSLNALRGSYLLRRESFPEFTDDDVILLIDQGGGSLEISYFFPENQQKRGWYSFADLGTITIRWNFFSTGINRDVEPSSNTISIEDQFTRLNSFITDKVEKWAGFPEILGKKLHIYAMGSAITSCYPGKTNFSVHNQIVNSMETPIDEGPLPNMKQIINHNCSSLSRFGNVTDLWSAVGEESISNETINETNDLDRQLVAAQGLPVFKGLLDKFGEKSLRICGYGLRYGIYRWVSMGFPLELLQKTRILNN